MKVLCRPSSLSFNMRTILSSLGFASVLVGCAPPSQEYEVVFSADAPKQFLIVENDLIGADKQTEETSIEIGKSGVAYVTSVVFKDMGKWSHWTFRTEDGKVLREKLPGDSVTRNFVELSGVNLESTSATVDGKSLEIKIQYLRGQVAR